MTLPRLQIDPAYTADPCAITVNAPVGAPTWLGATITVKAQVGNSGPSVVGSVSGLTATAFVMTFAADARAAGVWEIQARLALASGQVETLEFVQTVNQSIA